jgi:GTP-binding protein
LNETKYRNDIRNIAIIAHVDHGKTSTVDALLKQSKIFRDNEQVIDCVMDKNDLEKERHMTILAKNTAVMYKGVKINIIDTPGHVDFGGEVERVLNMANGCLLVVDSIDGPMPQTDTVLREALAKDLKVVVVINKMDRPTSRLSFVAERVQDLFLKLATKSEQLDFPILYASAHGQYAVTDPEAPGENMVPLFDAILATVPPPVIEEGPLQMLISNIDYDSYKGRIAIGRIFRGKIAPHDRVAVIGKGNAVTTYEVDQVFTYLGLERTSVPEASAGDIVAITGLSGVSIGDTVAAPEALEAMPRIEISEPTVKMTFCVNTSPFAGREARYTTTRQLRERLYRELETNLSLRVEDTASPDTFMVSGRGELHLSILIETMRREGYEFEVSRPEAITKEVNGTVMEPVEELTIDIPEQYMGAVSEVLGKRQARMTDMRNDGNGSVHLQYHVPTRGLIGFRDTFLTVTKGTGVMNTILLDYEPWFGEITNNRMGAIVSSCDGMSVTYSLNNAQARGITFIDKATHVYEGMIIGMTVRPQDIAMNVTIEKQQTNIRTLTNDHGIILQPCFKVTLDMGLAFISDDELLEVTPKALRLRKKILTQHDRLRDKYRTERSQEAASEQMAK